MAATVDATSPSPTADLVRTAARAYERDRYLAALLAPRDTRDDLIALAAFAGEIARIPSFVAEAMMGEIRLRWWRDALSAPVGEQTGHPIADALRQAIRRNDLPADELNDLIDAMSERLDDRPPTDESELASFLARTEGAQFRAAWRVLAGPRAVEPPEVLQKAGEAYGWARLLFELPAHLAEGRTLIPAGRLMAANVTLEALQSGTAGPAGVALLDALVAQTRRRLGELRAAVRAAPKPLRTVLLPVALIEPYLRALQRMVDDPRRVGDIAPLTRVWRLWVAHRFGRI